MILVTGGTGVIGSTVVKVLKGLGHEVIAPSRRSGYMNSLAEFLKTTKAVPHGLIHLAAAVPASRSLPDNVELSDETRRMDRVVCDAARTWATHLVYASGCSLYDNSRSKCQREAEPTASPITSSYLRAKKEGEEAALDVGHASVLRIAGFRGRGTPNWTVAGRFVAEIRNQRAPTVIGDGLDEVDLVDLSDIADAIVLSWRYSHIGILNIASGHPISIRDLASLICQVADTEVRPVFTGQQIGRKYARFDTARARSSLGWQPKVAIRDSIREMLSE